MLRDTIASLLGMEHPERVAYEVLVIDNDPAGSAMPVASQFLLAGTPPVRYVSHPHGGLSHARNRGIEEANGSMIAFVDDDVILDKNWLSSITECMLRTNAQCVGGRTVVKWEGRPDDVLAEYDTDLGEEDFQFLGPVLPGGCNCIFSRDVFAEGFRFSTDLGRIGEVLISGEDTEAFKRLLNDGKQIWYCGKAMVHHRAAGERLRKDYYIRRNYWFGISFAIIDKRMHGKSYQIAKASARAVKALMIHAPLWMVGRITGDPFSQFFTKIALARQFGYIRATFRTFSTTKL
jgi:glycosyltransferase involved in cell wall biosynthesis